MNCNDQILACLPSGCGCVKYDPVTGQLAIDGNLVELYMQPTTTLTAETLTGAVLNPSIEVGAAAVTGLCAAIGPCIAALPPGSIDVSALRPGAEGTVLQTLGGVATWAGLDDAAIQRAFGDNPIPQPPIDATELTRVYGEDANQNLTSVTPQGAYEAAVAGMPAATLTAPLKTVSGVDAGGMAVKADVVQVGQRTVGTSTPIVKQPFPTATDYVVATAVAPVSGLYGIEIAYDMVYYYPGGPALGSITNRREWYVTTSSGRPYDVVSTDIFAAAMPQAVNESMILDTVKTGTAIVKLTAGETVKLAVYANGSVTAGSVSLNGGIVLIKLADTQIVAAP